MKNKSYHYHDEALMKPPPWIIDRMMNQIIDNQKLSSKLIFNPSSQNKESEEKKELTHE